MKDMETGNQFRKTVLQWDKAKIDAYIDMFVDSDTDVKRIRITDDNMVRDLCHAFNGRIKATKQPVSAHMWMGKLFLFRTDR